MKIIGKILLLLALFFVGAACGQEAQEPSQQNMINAGEVAASPTPIDLLNSEEQVTVADTTTLEVEPAVDEETAVSEPAVISEADTGGGEQAAVAAGVDANGVPIGFTAEGIPYRGNLDAPIVIQEFSDYQ